MREMGFMGAAEPLTNATGVTVDAWGESGEGYEVRYGWSAPAGSASWDSRSLYGCVCDSSWKVRGF